MIQSLGYMPVADTLSPTSYQKLADILNQQLGIKLPASKRSMLEARLRPRMRTQGFANYADYCHHLFSEGGLNEELPHLIDAVTTNKTDFFREPSHFALLTGRLVPALLEDRARHTGIPLIKIWSAASSSGAEPYTIAMVMQDMVRTRQNFRFAVLGTDISTRVLSQAVHAVYPAEMIAPVPGAMQERYLLRSKDAGAPQVRVAPELRRLVRFSRLNLMDGVYPVDRDVDVIFLRNVLIYFEKADQEAVINRLMSHLRKGGYIILGHSEAMIGSAMGLRQIAPAIFIRE
jgi:chemotaxis protein methyltransferase CheR